jgi:integrase
MGATIQPQTPFVKVDAYLMWQDEIKTLAENTRELYREYFAKFLEYTGKTADKLLQDRITEIGSRDKATKRKAETTFKLFLATMKNFYKPKTMQSIYASIRSFYDAHEYPLIMKKRDYPKGEGIGQLRATPEAAKAIYEKANIPIKALITTLNDTGLGVSDIRHLKCNIILENPQAKLIHIRMIRQKTGDRIHTFLGEESIQALKDYLRLRETGTENISSETITPNSPLFRTWQHGQPKIPTRTNLSSLIAQAFNRVGYKHMSAHSFRKKLQTALEKSKMPTNWIDLILGHKLINSRDAYSLPTDEELEEEYEKAYNQHIRINPKTETPKQTPIIEVTTTGKENLNVAEARTMEEVKALLAKGYKYEMEMNGIKLFTKK